MKKYRKILLITAAALMVGGGIMVGAGVAAGGGIGYQISKNGIKTNKDLKEEFVEETISLEGVKHLKLELDDGEIKILEGEKFQLEYGYSAEMQEVHKNQDGDKYELKTKNIPSMFRSYISFGPIMTTYKTSYITIYIPKNKEFDSLSITNDYGDVRIEAGKMGDFTIIADSGDVSTENMSAGSVNIKAGYGDVSIKSCTADDWKLDCESGKAELEAIKAEQIDVKCGYGDLSLTDVETKELNLLDQSGEIELNRVKSVHADMENQYGATRMKEFTSDSLKIRNESGEIEGTQVLSGELDVKSDYGEITFDLIGTEDLYDIEALTDYGSIEINNKDYGTNFVREKGAKNKLKLKADSGDIKICTE